MSRETLSGLEQASAAKKTADVLNTVWEGFPAKEGQLLEEGQWKKGETRVYLLDLSKQEDLESYSNLINSSLKEDPTVIVLDEQKQFCNSSENWKVLITATDILYRQIIDNKNEQ